MKKQSRRMSLIEAAANVAVGYVLAIATQIFVFPLFGLHATLGQNLALGGLFTFASVFRSFALRRAFEAIRVGSSRTQAAAPSRAAARCVRPDQSMR